MSHRGILTGTSTNSQVKVIFYCVTVSLKKMTVNHDCPVCKYYVLFVIDFIKKMQHNNDNALLALQQNEEEEQTFFRLKGMDIMQRSQQGSLHIQDRRFRSVFGVGWLVCAKVWLLIKDDVLEDERKKRKRKDAREYLLWALMFLKLYTSLSDLASRARADEKTYKKRVEAILEIIA